MILKSVKTVATVVMMTATLPSVSQAADLPPVPDTSDWVFTAALYGWGAGIDGDIGVFGLPARHVDVTVGDVIPDLDFAFMGVAEARNGRFMMGVDITYTDVSQTMKSPVANPFIDKIDATNTSLMLTGLLGYSIYEADAMRLDFLAGARLWSVNNDFKVQGGLLDGVAKSDGATWVDPLVGAQLRLDPLPKVYVTSWAMIGGFGLGSDLMWDLMGGAGYEFTDWFSLFAGYRANKVNYSKDGFEYDVVQQGPLAALVFKF